MNNPTVKLQIPLNKSLRDQVAKHAQAQGFSSIQDFTRVMYTTLIRQNTQINLVSHNEERLSPAAEARYARQLNQYEKDKKAGQVESFDDVEDALNFLHSV